MNGVGRETLLTSSILLEIGVSAIKLRGIGFSWAEFSSMYSLWHCEDDCSVRAPGSFKEGQAKGDQDRNLGNSWLSEVGYRSHLWGCIDRTGPRDGPPRLWTYSFLVGKPGSAVPRGLYGWNGETVILLLRSRTSQMEAVKGGCYEGHVCFLFAWSDAIVAMICGFIFITGRRNGGRREIDWTRNLRKPTKITLKVFHLGHSFLWDAVTP